MSVLNVTPEDAKLLRLAVIGELFRKGDVHTWYLKPKQRTALEFLRATSDPFFEASRRWGKTTTTLSYSIEESIINSGFITRWCEPWKNQCREIVMTEMDQIQSHVPERYRFKWSGTDSFYRCVWNDSRIYLRGVNEDRGESARGTKANLIVCDEFGTWKEPVYIVNEILRPQTLTTNGKVIYTGTPPRNLAHAFYKLKDRAQFLLRFIQRTIKDQELTSWEKVEQVIADSGGWESAAVRREYLCEKIIDKNFAIIPEWDDRFIVDVPSDEFFVFYLKYDAVDTGVRDNTVCILAYYDFIKARLIVVDEIVLRGPEMTTEKLAELVRAKEETYWKIRWERYLEGDNVRFRAHSPPHLLLRRVSDIDLRLVNDLSTLHGLYFDPTDKGKLDEMVNHLRILVGQGRVLVNPRCKNLIDCLRYGLWDEDRKKWDRPEQPNWDDKVEFSEFLGHFDALAALMYLVRNLDDRTNPIPADYGKPHDEWFYAREVETQRDVFKKMMNVK